MNKNIYKRKNVILSNTLILIKNICLALLITLVFAFASGFKMLNIVTGSMAPTMPVNTVIVIKKIPIEKVEVGDVVTFKSGEYNVTHRVYGVELGGTRLITKGDAPGASIDQSRVTEANLVGVVVMDFPYMGYVLEIIKQNIVIITVCIVLALFIVTYS